MVPTDCRLIGPETIGKVLGIFYWGPDFDSGGGGGVGTSTLMVGGSTLKPSIHFEQMNLITMFLRRLKLFAGVLFYFETLEGGNLADSGRGGGSRFCYSSPGTCGKCEGRGCEKFSSQPEVENLPTHILENLD